MATRTALLLLLLLGDIILCFGTKSGGNVRRTHEMRVFRASHGSQQTQNALHDHWLYPSCGCAVQGLKHTAAALWIGQC